MDKQNPCILTVDADPNMIRAVSAALGAKGFDLISALTGSEALIQIGKRRADVALIDVQRGDMSGLDLLREIKARSPETECILLTGTAAQSSAIKAVQAEVFVFFQKPFDLEQIFLSIQRAAEKKRSAQALQESERLAHATLDALSSHIAVLDESGKIIAVNRAWRIFAAANLPGGLELNSFVGENYLSVCETASGPGSEGAAEMAAGIRSVAMGKQEQFSLEYPCHSPNERRWFNAHVSRFSGAGPLRIIVAHENITERILAEGTLRDRETSLQTILQSTADGILAVNHEGKVLYANERFVRMWRIPKTVMEGVDDSILLKYILDQLIDSQGFLQKVQELYESDEESFDTLYFKDGRIFERLSRSMLQETKPRGRVWSFRDITERKLADALTLRQSEQLQLLYDASQRLNRTLDLNEIYQAICDFMSIIAPNDGLVISSFDPESQLITCRAYWMGNKWLDVSSFPSIPLEEEGKGAQSIAIRTGRSMLVNDCQALMKTAQTSYYVNDETNKADKETPPEDEEITRSALIVPLKTGEMVSGVIQVLSYQLNAYTEDQLKLLEALALHIVSAEKNALLYIQAQAELNERKQAEGLLRENQKRYHELFEDSPIALVEEDFSAVKQRLDTLRKEGVTDFHVYLANHPEVMIECAKMVVIKDVNKAALTMYRADSRNKMPKNLSEILRADALENFINQLANIANGQVMFSWEGINHAIDGSQMDVEVNWSAAGYEKDLSKVIVSLQDITERKKSEANILRLNRLYATFSEINQTIVRVRDQQTLFEEICHVTVEYGQFRMAWIGLINETDQSVRPSAFAGEELGYLTNVKITYNEMSSGLGPTGTAVREGRCVICQDIATNPPTLPWREQALLRGYLSSASLPIFKQQRIIGALTVYASEVHGFDAEDEKLLDKIGKNISFALNTMQVESQRELAEESMRQRVLELELLYESGLAFIQLLNPNEIAQKVINLLEQKMDWHHTAIRLYDSETNTLRLLAFNQPSLVSVEEKTAVEEQVKGRLTRLDRGVSGWVVQHGQIVRSDDLANDKRYFDTLPGMKSGLYVPIKLGDRVIGVISIESEKPNAFSEADERLANTLANQAASALENARLFDETQRHIRELTALHRASQTLLAAHLDPEQIYAAVHKAVAQTMPCEAFVIVLDDANRSEYHTVYFFDKGERFPARWLPRNTGISGRVISSGQTLLINDVLAENLQATHFGSMESTRSILAVPLRRGAEIVGMISTQSYQPNAFGESQRALLETITAQFSSTLDNAHLYLQTQARINELETLHVISTSLRTIQTVDEALSTMLDNTLATLDTDAGSILLYDPPSKELRDVVVRGWFTNLAETSIKAGEGVAGTVFVSGEPYYAVEFVRDTLPHAATCARVPAGWGGVCLPIRTFTEIIGVMFVSVQLPRQITPQQIRMLESLVDMTGAALHRMRLHNETARRAEEFAVLYETSKALAAEYDLNSLLGVIVTGARNMLNASTSGMYLYHAESKEMELVMDTSPTIPIGSRLLPGEGVAGKVAQTRQPLRIEDYSTWEGRSLKFGSLPIRAVIEVPMLYAGELIGVLTADEIGDSSRKFTDADERLLSLFASQAAGAINAARHREETIHYAEELERRVIERTAEIEATRQRLDLAASAGGIGVWEVNLKDNTVFWDTQMHIIHGTGKMDFDNSFESWRKMLHPEDVARTQKQFENALQNNGIFMDEYRILLPDASMRHIAANAIVLYDAEHNPERVIGVNMDITERKKSEEILYHANMEMERALRTKDEFLATMSHELRTPLNSILGISESLEEQFVGALNEKQLKYTGIIRESGRHLLELINDILDISKIEAGRMELEVQNLSIEKICQSSLRLIRELAQKKNLNVSFEIRGNAKTLLGDERRLKQSLVNLLGNAVKFTPQGGAIGLEVEGYAARNEVTFTVWDKGVGIADEDIQHLFKPFVQLDSGLAREYQGTGLGLALVSQMIRLHGGRVHVESILGQGSRFIITMPWMKDQQNTQVAGTGELSARRLRPVMRQSGKILLVEDTNVVVTLMTEYLHFKGYKVLIARNGVEGVQLAKQEHPDLILMDVMMPVMDGLEATRQIRADASLRNIPIIALTALAMTGDRERCLVAGMNDYLSKPIKMQELADMIEKYLGAGRPVAQPE